MTFADLVAGDSVFVDANTLAYHFEPHPCGGRQVGIGLHHRPADASA